MYWDFIRGAFENVVLTWVDHIFVAGSWRSQFEKWYFHWTKHSFHDGLKQNCCIYMYKRLFSCTLAVFLGNFFFSFCWSRISQVSSKPCLILVSTADLFFRSYYRLPLSFESFFFSLFSLTFPSVYFPSNFHYLLYHFYPSNVVNLLLTIGLPEVPVCLIEIK